MRSRILAAVFLALAFPQVALARGQFDPTKEFASDFRVIGMDQRNAGQSRAPITAADSWATYAADHVALLDHLQIKRTHIMGGCIGSSYCLGLLRAALVG